MDNYHNLADTFNAMQKRFYHSQIPLIIFNGTSSIRKHVATVFNNINNLVLANKIKSNVAEAETDRNYWRITQDGFAVDKQVPADATYHGTFPSGSIIETQQ